MQIFRLIAGYSFGHADIVRRAISKKKSDVLNSEREAFVNGAVSRGVSESNAISLFDEIVSFANYAFNKSHAAAYAVLSFRTAYLKAHFPLEYYSALLTSVFGSAEKIGEYTTECKKLGIRVLPPDVNTSKSNFCVQNENIRYGLLSLKNIGNQFVNDLINERINNGNFKHFDDFITRMQKHNMNKKQLEALIKSGSLDSLGAKRSQMLSVHESVLDRSSSKFDEGQLDLFSFNDNISTPDLIDLPDIPEFSTRDKLFLEKESCGVYLSGHILDDYSKNISDISPTNISYIKAQFSEEHNNELSEYNVLLKDRSRVTIVGIVTSRTNKTTRNGGNLAFVDLEDTTGEIEIICFPKACADYAHLLTVNSIVRIDGSISLKDDEEVKIILNFVEPLSDNSEYVPQKKKYESQVKETKSIPHSNALNITANKQINSISKLYLKIPSSDSDEFVRAVNFVGIFEGSTPIIFYDSQNGTSMKMLGNVNSFIISELEDILGKDNVVAK